MKLEELFEAMLMEYDEAKTLGVFRNKLISRLNQDDNGLVNTDIDWDDDEEVMLATQAAMRVFGDADPTRNNAYTRWIVQVYANGGIDTLDYLPDVRELLVKYDDLKKRKLLRPEDRSIDLIKSMTALDDVVGSYEGAQSGKQQQANIETQMIRAGDARVIYEDALVKVVSPETEEASCHFGKGTKWCTIGRENNMFDHYHAQGPLYIISFKGTPHKWQFSISGDEYMDETNHTVRDADLLAFLPTAIKWVPQNELNTLMEHMLDLLGAEEVVPTLSNDLLARMYDAKPVEVYNAALGQQQQFIDELMDEHLVKLDRLKFHETEHFYWFLDPFAVNSTPDEKQAWVSAVSFDEMRSMLFAGAAKDDVMTLGVSMVNPDVDVMFRSRGELRNEVYSDWTHFQPHETEELVDAFNHLPKKFLKHFATQIESNALVMIDNIGGDLVSPAIRESLRTGDWS